MPMQWQHSKGEIFSYNSRTYAMLKFLEFLDELRLKVGPWVKGALWRPRRFYLNPA